MSSVILIILTNIRSCFEIGSEFADFLRNIHSRLKHRVLISLLLFASLASAVAANGQTRTQTAGNYDVFNPITKYIRLGDAEKLSAWFSDNLEITVFSVTNDTSKNQAKQILRSFFDTYAPRAFVIEHTVGRDAMKYALGTLKAGGETFQVTIFVSRGGNNYLIQQIKIEKND